MIEQDFVEIEFLVTRSGQSLATVSLLFEDDKITFHSIDLTAFQLKIFIIKKRYMLAWWGKQQQQA